MKKITQFILASVVILTTCFLSNCSRGGRGGRSVGMSRGGMRGGMRGTGPSRMGRGGMRGGIGPSRIGRGSGMRGRSGQVASSRITPGTRGTRHLAMAGRGRRPANHGRAKVDRGRHYPRGYRNCTGYNCAGYGGYGGWWPYWGRDYGWADFGWDYGWWRYRYWLWPAAGLWFTIGAGPTQEYYVLKDDTATEEIEKALDAAHKERERISEMSETLRNQYDEIYNELNELKEGSEAQIEKESQIDSLEKQLGTAKEKLYDLDVKIGQMETKLGKYLAKEAS